jgi:creatinine amidohydrolase
MQLQLSTWQEVENYLCDSTGILMPIGSTEQHGPNGLIGTDAICAEVIARGVGERAGAMVGPTIGVGMAEHHMQFAGSMTLRASTLILVVRDYVLSLARHGFRRFLFVNGHGGNVATLRAAFSEMYGELRLTQGDAAPDLRCRLVNWWENDKVGALSKELYGKREGSHATPSEVAVTQYAYPGKIKHAVLDPEQAPGGGFYDSRDYRRRFPDGRIGSAPGLATPEHGGQLVEAAVGAISATYAGFLAEP